jgi:hypothetical protein
MIFIVTFDDELLVEVALLIELSLYEMNWIIFL